ncbi:High-affinity branched-chain amino acid transport system permease protein LivH (TC 3.A.1.4.1) [hydrothermal vent metagenome]|uniref:High-affinity branched-chain amino acid transport system permease protein LivH (TC 3.A.1.4.1) n=1 Tax=hydrothermal vent metagenome TaxID=652676 RepID=A0A3B0RDE2_9ZZZZ
MNGLVLGLLLFLIAAGFSLIFGLMNVVNLAHGSFLLFGAYIGLIVIRATGNFWLALIVAPIVTGALGLVVEVTLLRKTYQRGHLIQVLLTLGLALIAADLMRWTFGAYVESIDAPALLAGLASVFGQFEIPVYRLAIIVFGLVMAAGMWLILERTRLGAIVRAGVQDGEMVGALGINIERVVAGVFVFGTALAGVSGVLAAPVLSIYPGLDFEFLILAMVVVVVGGMGSLKGAFWGALLVGMTDVLGKAYFPEFSLFAIFLIMALVLLVRPQGLFGIREVA